MQLLSTDMHTIVRASRIKLKRQSDSVNLSQRSLNCFVVSARWQHILQLQRILHYWIQMLMRMLLADLVEIFRNGETWPNLEAIRFWW